MEKYIKDGKVAILYSPGFGAGWSTWGEEKLAWDKRVVEYYLEHKDDKEFMRQIDIAGSKVEKEAEKYFEELGYPNIYFGGFNELKIGWLKEGTKYHINEYDGSEYIQTVDNMKWSVA